MNTRPALLALKLVLRFDKRKKRITVKMFWVISTFKSYAYNRWNSIEIFFQMIGVLCHFGKKELKL